MNEGTKYPIRSADRDAIVCYTGYCAWFGGNELLITSDSNHNTDSCCNYGRASFNLPESHVVDNLNSSMNGGIFARFSLTAGINGRKKNFQLK